MTSHTTPLTRTATRRHALLILALGAIVLAAAALWSTAVAAAPDSLGAIVNNVAEDSRQAASGIKILFYFIGFILVGVGVVMLVSANRRGSGLGAPITMIVVGILLLGYTQFIQSGSGTVFDSPSADGLSELQQ